MLAIIIPFFKLTFFEATLQSLANQTDKRFKVYIGDDASPDDCSTILQKFDQKIDFNYHRFKTNLGATSLTKHWERCIMLSKDEDWIMVLGDDDMLGDNVVSEFNKLIDLQTKDLNLIRCNLNILKNKNQLEKNYFDYQPHELSNRFLERIFSTVETITASEFIFSRELYLKKNGFVDFPLAWFSDYATWLNFSKESGIYNLLEAKVYWRLSNENISSKKDDIKTSELKIKSLFLFVSFLDKNFNIKNQMLISFAKLHLKNLLSAMQYKNYTIIFFKSFVTSPSFFKFKLFSSFIVDKIRKKRK